MRCILITRTKLPAFRMPSSLYVFALFPGPLPRVCRIRISRIPVADGKQAGQIVVLPAATAFELRQIQRRLLFRLVFPDPAANSQFRVPREFLCRSSSKVGILRGRPAAKIFFHFFQCPPLALLRHCLRAAFRATGEPSPREKSSFNSVESRSLLVAAPPQTAGLLHLSSDAGAAHAALISLLPAPADLGRFVGGSSFNTFARALPPSRAAFGQAYLACPGNSAIVESDPNSCCTLC